MPNTIWALKLTPWASWAQLLHILHLRHQAYPSSLKKNYAQIFLSKIYMYIIDAFQSVA